MSVKAAPIKMCLFSELVYKGRAIALPYLNSIGFTYADWFEAGEAVSFIAYNQRRNELVICFRGTPQLDRRAIISYISTIHKKVTYNGCIHRRFYKAFTAVQNDMKSYISILPTNSTTKIICTGHSLGAAIATVAAKELEADELYTFGSPRVGNKTYVEYLHKSNITPYRYVNNNDIITALPFAFMGYHHFGDAIYFNHYGRIREQSIWQLLKDRVRGSVKFLYKKEAYDSLFDHKIVKYREKLENNVSTQSKN